MPTVAEREFDIHSADALLSLSDGEHYELVDLMPVEKVMGAEAEHVALGLARLLFNHCADRKLGLVFGSKTSYRCFPDDPQRVRQPDASVVRAGRLDGDRPPRGFITVAPDLAVEVISPNDLYEDVEERVTEYRAAGVPLVWVINPSTRTVLIRRLDRTCAEVGPDGELSGEDVIPGFACKVADLFV